jgi:hypothetical protein
VHRLSVPPPHPRRRRHHHQQDNSDITIHALLTYLTVTLTIKVWRWGLDIGMIKEEQDIE